jgi:hypothetical protein
MPTFSQAASLGMEIMKIKKILFIPFSSVPEAERDIPPL